MAPLTAGPHPGQDGLDHGDGTEEVGREQLGDGVVLAFFYRGPVSVAGVVDENVDASEPVGGLLHGARDLGVVRHVERYSERGLGVGIDQVLDLRHVASGHDRVVAGLQHGLSEVPAEAGRATSDEPGGHVRDSFTGFDTGFMSGGRDAPGQTTEASRTQAGEFGRDYPVRFTGLESGTPERFGQRSWHDQRMADPGVEAAANNAGWCDAVCRALGLPTRWTADAWAVDAAIAGRLPRRRHAVAAAPIAAAMLSLVDDAPRLLGQGQLRRARPGAVGIPRAVRGDLDPESGS